MTFFIIIISLGYAITLLSLAVDTLHYTPRNITQEKATSFNGFTVIINYRNEAHHLPILLKSLVLQLNSGFKNQFIFVNDDSKDHGFELVEQFIREHAHLDIIHLNRKPVSASAKKDGIAQAIIKSNKNHIITTDADCVLPNTWLLSFTNMYVQNPFLKFIAGPVIIDGKSGWITHIQHLEMVALQVITAGGFSLRKPFMCNGANMSFTREVFYEVQGYEGNTTVSSGDDVFLLEKIAAIYVDCCAYLQNDEATVTTFPKKTWSAAIAQRARWAQKGNRTKSLLNKLISFQVLLMNLGFILLPLLWILQWMPLKAVVFLWVLKIFTDFIIIVIGHINTDNRKWILKFPLQTLIYPFFVMHIAFASLKQQQWHGREVKH